MQVRGPKYVYKIMLGIVEGKTVRREKSLKIRREGTKLEPYEDSSGVQVP